MPKSKNIRELVPSVISREYTIYGDIMGEGALEIDCKVNGNIRCVSLIVKENAIIQGDVICEKLEVYGEIFGNVKSKNMLCCKGSKIIGDILHLEIKIENGAFIDGNCKKFNPT